MTTSQNIRVGLLSTEPEMSIWLCEDIGCESSDNGQICNFSNRQLSFHVANADVSEGRVQENSGKYQVFVGIVRFVDVLSLQQMDQLFRQSGAGKNTPTLVLVYRNENEVDFKMSCPYCGQKLWVRDVDQDKRGRCPHCSKGFTLPKQEDHIRSSLRLPPAVQVRKIIRQDSGTFAGPLREIIHLASVESSLESLGLERESAINDTMRVNVLDEGGE